MVETVVQGQYQLLEKTIVEAMSSKSPAASNISFSSSHNSGFQLAHKTKTISNLRRDDFA